MGIDLEQRNLNVLRTVGQGFAETVVEKTLTLPTDLAELSEIEEDPVVWVGGIPKVVSVETEDGEVIIKGYIETNVLYVSNQRDSYVIEKAVFQDTRSRVAMPLDEAGDNLYVKPEVTLAQISAEGNDGRSVLVCATLAVKAEISYINEMEVTVEALPTGNTRFNANKQTVQMQEYITDIDEDINVKESFPVIDDEVDFEGTLKCAAMGTARLVHVIVGDGKVTVDAEIKVQGAYEITGDFPSVNIVNCEKVSVHETFDVPEAQKGMNADVTIELVDIKFFPSIPDSFEMEACIKVTGKLLQPNEVKVVTEIMSESSDIVDSDVKMVSVNEEISREFFNITIDENVQIDPDVNSRMSSNYRDAIYSSGFAYLTDLQVSDGEISVKGVLSARLTCERDVIDDSTSTGAFSFDVPIEFSDSVEVAGVFEDDRVLADLKVNSLRIERNAPARLNIEADMGLDLEVLRPNSLTLIESADLITPVELDPCALTFYVSSEGDSLTKVARKYRVSPERLAKVNGLNIADRLEAGKKVFIPLN